MVFIVFILNICPKSISGWWYTYPKSMSSSVGVTIPKIWKVINKMFQATNQIWNSSCCLQATPLLASKRSFSAVPLAPANNGPEHWCRKPVFGGCQCCDVATFTRIGLVRICDSNIPIFERNSSSYLCWDCYHLLSTSPHTESQSTKITKILGGYPLVN